MTRRRLTFALALALTLPLALPPAVSAGVPPRQEAPLSARLAEVERRFEAARMASHVPGASIVVVKDGRVVLAKGFGWRDVDGKKPATADTLFAIGSTTKAFTAMLAAIATDERKLGFDDSPRKVLPAFRLQDPEASRKAVMRDLLSHRTGVGRTDLATLMGGLSREENLRLMARVKPQAPFRKAFLYNNQMYTVAGLALGKAYGTSWEALVSRRLLTPLGMASTTLDAKGLAAARDHALGYQYLMATGETRAVPIRDIGGNAPAGAINSNARDMGRWLTFLLDGGMVKGKRLVSAAAFAECFKPHTAIAGPLAYGLGWMLNEWHGHQIATHDGRIDGYGAHVSLMPDQRLGLAVLTNSTEHDLGEKAMAAVFEELVGAPEPPASPGASEAFLDSLAHRALLGPYKAEGADFKVELGEHEGHVALKVAGQPAYALKPDGAESYALAGLPAAFRLILKRDGEGRVESFELKQPQGAMVFRPLPRYTAPISVDTLMAKAIEAEGGEAALRRHTSMVRHLRLDLEHQGMTAEAVVKTRAPGQIANRATYFALGKKLGWAFEYCDGQKAGSVSSFSPPDVSAGKALADARRNADFYASLNWRRQFRKVEIRELGQVGVEPAYVVVKTPREGNAVTDYLSASTFRLLRRDTLVTPSNMAISLPMSETYSDFREVDGLVMPFKSVLTTPTMGTIRIVTTKVELDVPLADSEFQP